MMKFVVIAAVITISCVDSQPSYDTPDSLCDMRRDGHYPHPAACGAILSCSGYRATQQHCAGSLVFMPSSVNGANTGRCEYSGCTKAANGVITRTTSPGCGSGRFGAWCQCTGPVDPCENEDCNFNGVCRHKWDCSTARCDCNGNWRGDTCDRQIATPAPPAPDACPNSLCDGKLNGDYEDPINPNVYLQCSNGYAYCKQCQEGLIFNRFVDPQKCDWPANVAMYLE